MLKNRLIAIIGFLYIAVTMALTLTACGAVENKETPTSTIKDDTALSETQSTAFVGGMEFIAESSVGWRCRYYREVVTDVIYLVTYGDVAVLTVMLDPDTGLPLTYTRYLELAQDGKNNPNEEA